MTANITILTISDTRTEETDLSGNRIMQLAHAHRQTVLSKHIVKDDVSAIQASYQQLCTTGCDLIITNGGTGIAPRDVTIEALQSFLIKEMPGFGELFRWLSYQEIGAHAMASRALAGINEHQQLLFILPGSVNACHLAVETLILPEIDHLMKECKKYT
ncbi:hypothetical protein A5886_001060 [Enterococcus sp. 8G7_MSG3316]|uniref:Molybdenum cofactor biosynthesis protein B n=1 Tax=Candidatus Enterococcus testudinis TaxID=1834191 RepID=A0A242A4N4_9ENTE|nr:molybdenum cofactor biosynthesis protein B [Enterococcus sp. 8G7_MSG3316]OTN75984.1 hypothetical protein A5886_001060 [Enterococcus sp. 8G7_MSG3316]